MGLRNFSAPVVVEYDYTADKLAFLLAHDSDPFNRWEAGQRLATRELLTLAEHAATGKALELDDTVVAAFGRVLPDAVGIRRPQYSLATVGGRASKASYKSEVTTLFRVRQTHTEYGSTRYRGARSPELTTL